MLGITKKDVLKVEWSAWHWGPKDVESENDLERELGLALTRPGWYAQRRKADRSGYHKAQRFAKRKTRDEFIQRENKRLMKSAGKAMAIGLIKETP